MALDLLKARGTPLDRQRFTWRELVQEPYSKLDDDAAGDGEMTEQFRAALESEGEHLDMVRGWVAAGTGRSVEDARGRRVHPEPSTAARTGGSSQTDRRARRKSPRPDASRSRKRTSTKTKRKRSVR